MNRFFKLIFAVSIISVLWSCAKEEYGDMDDKDSNQVSTEAEPSPYLPGTAIIKVNEDLQDLISSDISTGKIITRSMELNQMVDEFGITSIERLFPDAGEFEPRTKAAGLDKWYRVKYDNAKSVTRASVDFESIDGIVVAEPEHRLERMSFNDPGFSQQWGFYNPDTDANGNRKVIDINVQPVWDEYTTGSSNVIVGVIDGGILLSHPDLAASVIAAGSTGSKNFVDNSYTIVPESHGTHVAGTIGAINNNETGVCGTAGGDAANDIAGVKLLSCQIFKGDLSNGSAEAIKWAADHGAVIINNSWGYVVDQNGDGTISAAEREEALTWTISSSEKEAVDYFIQYAGCDNSGNQLSTSPMKGGVVIFAAGNDGIENGAPANYENVVAVGAINRSGSRTSFSNYGDWVDICAPGDGIYSTGLNDGYVTMDGTSMACPHVTGVAALIASYFGGQGFTNEMLLEKLLKGADSSKVSATSKIGPLVDALGAITYGSSDIPEKVSDYTVTAESNTLNFTWNATQTLSGKKTYGYLILANKDENAFSDLDPRNPASSFKTVSVVMPSSANIGDELSGALTGLDFESTYYVAIYGYDYSMNFSEISDIKSVTTYANNYPVITRTDTASTTLKSYEKQVYNFTISDADAHDVTVNFDGGSSAANLSFVSGTSKSGMLYNLTVNAPDEDAGTYTVTITATDSYNAATTYTFTYTVLENHAPEAVKEFDDIITNNIGQQYTFLVSDYFSDPDGEDLTYTYSMTATGIINLNKSGNTIYATILSTGGTIVTITATDAKGLSVSSQLRVLVREDGVFMDAYPNPFTTTLNIRTGTDEVSTHVKITSSTGSVAYDETSTFSAFNPLVIDTSDLAPGTYSLEVSYGGGTYNQKIIKK